MIFVDTHCHLHMDYYKKDRDEVIKRAYQEGLIFMLTIGISAKDSESAYTLAQKYDRIFASVGIHPHDAKSATNKDFETIKKLCSFEKVVAIGEIGLDFYRNLSPREVQKSVFERLLALAQELEIPVIIHTREAQKETKDILRQFDVKGIIHCFSGNKKDAKDYLDMGFYISFAGNITYGNLELEDAAKVVPLDRIFVETDAPFLTPHPLRGKRNEPAFVKYTVVKLSRLKSVSENVLIKSIQNNIKTLFCY